MKHKERPKLPTHSPDSWASQQRQAEARGELAQLRPGTRFPLARHLANCGGKPIRKTTNGANYDVSRALEPVREQVQAGED
jgi:uncharacterized protein involved in type VI secretion and phage assembly